MILEIHFSIQPVVIFILGNLIKMFDYLEFELLQISISTDNETNYVLDLEYQAKRLII